MTTPINPSDSSQPAGMPEQSVANILQRGGEELAVEKVSDRFTVRSTSPAVLTNLTQQIAAKSSHSIPKAQLQEFVVAPNQRDQAMQAARASD